MLRLCTSLRRSITWRKNLRTLWIWGNADFGRSGVDETYSFDSVHMKQHLDPVELKLFPQNLIQQLVCGGAHTLLVSASGRLYSCGLGSQGQLGNGLYESQGDFQPISNLDNVRHASAGYWHSAAVTKNGELFTWGCNKNNQLGVFRAEHTSVLEHNSAIPIIVSSLKGSRVVQVECGAYHTIALTDNKEVYSWGKGSNGRLGHGSEDDEALPRRIDSLRKHNIVSIAAGYDHSAAISAEGTLWTWGHGGWHQLGTGDKNDRLLPTIVDIESNVKQISCGGFHSAAVSHNGTLFTWGIGMYGALGLGDDTPSVVVEPSEVQLVGVKQVACGWKHCIALTRLGDVFAWGHGAAGQLGMGNEHDLWAPARVPRLVGKSARSVSAGFNHSAAF